MLAQARAATAVGTVVDMPALRCHDLDLNTAMNLMQLAVSSTVTACGGGLVSSSSGSTSSSQWTANSTSSSGATSSTIPPTGSSGLSVVSSTLSVSRGGEASVTVKTKPGAVGTIEVDYKSGPSHAKELTSQTANSQGLITWQWKVGTSTSLGTWPVHISADGKSITVYLHVN